ncbi:MAG: ribose-phosphate diphosphokinase [Halobacteriota archaeon]
MKIVGGPASQLLAARVARSMKCELALVEFKEFPDGELYLRIVDELDADTLVIQSTTTNDQIIYLLQLIDAVSDGYLRVVIPYFGYARQDKRFKLGEPISARAIARTIEADEVYVINIHDQHTLEHFQLRGENSAINLSAAQTIGSHLKQMNFVSPLLISPDEGAVQLVHDVAQAMQSEFDVLVKKRVSPEQVQIQPKTVDVDERDVVIVDDMISTGGTMAEAIKLLRGQGARQVHVACIHPVLSLNARLRLYRAGVDSILATDTIERAESCISVAPLIKQGVKEHP